MHPPTRELIDGWGDMIWTLPAESLQAAEPALRELLRDLGVPPLAILAELCDEILALAVQKRFVRREACEELFVHRYERKILQWLYHRSANRDLALDLVQELYVRLLSDRTLANYHADCRFHPWLWRVVRNLWIDHLRQQGREAVLPDHDLPADLPGPVEEAVARELSSHVERMIARLPTLQRDVLQLAMLGSSPDDIAAAVGQPKQRVYAQLHKARRRIEEGLKQGEAPFYPEKFPSPEKTRP